MRNHLVFGVKAALLIPSAQMTTLAEIENAAEALPPVEKQELLLFLAARLGAAGLKLPGFAGEMANERQEWISFAAGNLERAYGDDEPDYPDSSLKESNPAYAGR
jgi:hypothetical protein